MLGQFLCQCNMPGGVAQARQAREVKPSLVPGQRLRCCIAQARQAIEVKVSLMLGQRLRCCIAQAGQAR